MPTTGPGRRELVVGGAAGTVLGVVGALAPAAPAGAAGIATRSQLTAALDRYMATRSGVAGLGYLDNRNRQYYFWRPRSMQSHSTIKVLVLVTLLRLAEQKNRSLTTTERSLAARMIRYSDNDATDALVRQVGVTACRRVAGELSMDRTTVLGGTVFRSSTWWGHSVVTTRDLLRLENCLVYSGYLTPASRVFARRLMETVTSSQTWGLGDGLPSTAHVELKNGWGPRSDGYRLNCVGHVRGSGRSYQMSILSRSGAGYSYGQATVNRLSRIVWDALDTPLA
ncbi:serine hydrolase [Phycicoccus avicenniae]|uniref:serine hydrolase n=1 Tax=Phycicoccus avicenniae TaxID=2828860 RepID=UPI003D283713